MRAFCVLHPSVCEHVLNLRSKKEELFANLYVKVAIQSHAVNVNQDQTLLSGIIPYQSLSSTMLNDCPRLSASLLTIITHGAACETEEEAASL